VFFTIRADAAGRDGDALQCAIRRFRLPPLVRRLTDIRPLNNF
jgi:hypothetical protein